MAEIQERSKVARVKCWKCGKKVRVRKDGSLGSHGAQVAYFEGYGEVLVGYCNGSGARP